MSRPLAALTARYHRAFNERDFDAWREVFHEDVELVVDGMTFTGVDAALAYGAGSVAQFPSLYIGAERIVAENGDVVVAEIDMVHGDPAGGVSRRQGTVCEICVVRDGRIASVRSYYMAEPSDAEEAVRVPARSEATVLAEEQAALRRVATLVARGSSEDELFDTVTREIGWLVAADPTSLLRFEPDDTLTLVAAWSATRSDFPIGATHPVDDELRALRETGRPLRWGPSELPESGPFVEEARGVGVRTAVGVPIVVDGDVWGVAFASSAAERPFADDAETRIAGFTELVATAIANTQARADLAASRARLVVAGDEERRRVVRDLHDGAQQRLVHTLITLKQARQALPPDAEPATALLDDALGHAELAMTELRELAHGIMPAVLTRGGLRAAVTALGSRAPVPVEIDVPPSRLPPHVEATAYFVVAEALTNVAKHAHAARATVRASIDDGVLRVAVRDDGVGGARTRGSGVLGLADRVAVLGGRLVVDSPQGGGTLVAAEIPIAGG